MNLLFGSESSVAIATCERFTMDQMLLLTPYLVLTVEDLVAAIGLCANEYVDEIRQHVLKCIRTKFYHLPYSARGHMDAERTIRYCTTDDNGYMDFKYYVASVSSIKDTWDIISATVANQNISNPLAAHHQVSAYVGGIPPPPPPPPLPLSSSSSSLPMNIPGKAKSFMSKARELITLIQESLPKNITVDVAIDTLCQMHATMFKETDADGIEHAYPMIKIDNGQLRVSKDLIDASMIENPLMDATIEILSHPYARRQTVMTCLPNEGMPYLMHTREITPDPKAAILMCKNPSHLDSALVSRLESRFSEVSFHLHMQETHQFDTQNSNMENWTTEKRQNARVPHQLHLDFQPQPFVRINYDLEEAIILDHLKRWGYEVDEMEGLGYPNPLPAKQEEDIQRRINYTRKYPEDSTRQYKDMNTYRALYQQLRSEPILAETTDNVLNLNTMVETLSSENDEKQSESMSLNAAATACVLADVGILNEIPMELQEQEEQEEDLAEQQQEEEEAEEQEDDDHKEEEQDEEDQEEINSNAMDEDDQSDDDDDESSKWTLNLTSRH